MFQFYEIGQYDFSEHLACYTKYFEILIALLIIMII